MANWDLDLGFSAWDSSLGDRNRGFGGLGFSAWKGQGCLLRVASESSARAEGIWARAAAVASTHLFFRRALMTVILSHDPVGLDLGSGVQWLGAEVTVVEMSGSAVEAEGSGAQCPGQGVQRASGWEEGIWAPGQGPGI